MRAKKASAKLDLVLSDLEVLIPQSSNDLSQGFVVVFLLLALPVLFLVYNIHSFLGSC
jgi:hypothetical protein